MKSSKGTQILQQIGLVIGTKEASIFERECIKVGLDYNEASVFDLLKAKHGITTREEAEAILGADWAYELLKIKIPQLVVEEKHRRRKEVE